MPAIKQLDQWGITSIQIKTKTIETNVKIIRLKSTFETLSTVSMASVIPNNRTAIRKSPVNSFDVSPGNNAVLVDRQSEATTKWIADDGSDEVHDVGRTPTNVSHEREQRDLELYEVSDTRPEASASEERRCQAISYIWWRQITEIRRAIAFWKHWNEAKIYRFRWPRKEEWQWSSRPLIEGRGFFHDTVGHEAVRQLPMSWCHAWQI